MKSNTNNTAAGSADGNKTGIAGRGASFPAACGILLACLFLLCGMSAKPPAKVAIRTLKNGDYQLLVCGRPYVVKGVCYNPVPIGQGSDYAWWQDTHKPWLTDGRMMKAMGVNTIRLYEPADDAAEVKAVLNDLYKFYNIRVIMGNWLGFWEYPGPFYGDRDFRDKVKEKVLEMVRTYKDEPGILFWLLGNENNYSFSGQINPWSTDEIDKEPDPIKQRAMRARIYYTFVNELAQEIHKIDPYHPVALGNGELVGLECAANYCPDVDLLGCIIYRGKTFGNLFNSLKATFDKPVVLTEFGADSYDSYRNREDQDMQAFFLESQWRQIYQNLAGSREGTGNCLGGVMFEWTDEWWKNNPNSPATWTVQDTQPRWSNGSYYFDIKAKDSLNMNEEWFGIVALSPNDKGSGLDLRIPRKAYYVVREFWKRPRNNREIQKEPLEKNTAGSGLKGLPIKDLIKQCPLEDGKK
ncbi:MAG: hypothetical protein GX598_00960 [Elusimicrobia bacterium]|nr:hypothetical protein [Elusimicrobiota bacterium]